MQYCDCNIVPGILGFGEFHDVAGLIAPRRLLVVHGRQDPLFTVEEIDRAVADLQEIFDSAGVPDNLELRYGDGGHRFYKDLMWSWVRRT
jgi:hypothetical protein